MKQLYSAIQRFVRDEEGVTAIEYALIASLIAVVIIGTVQLTGTAINTTFRTICNALQSGACG